MRPPVLRVSTPHLLLIILAQVLALIAQAWLLRVLQARGYDPTPAHHLAYLIVPPILLLLLAPVLREHRAFVARLFCPRGLTVRLVLAAFALGVVARIAWWSQLLARVSFGIAVNDDPQAIAGPVFSWACPRSSSLMLGLFVMAMLVPVMEETLHRGFLQSAFVPRGPVTAVLISALIFTVFHPPSYYWMVFIMGIVFGAQFWVTGSLWAPMITHATYNGLIQIDWRCLHGQWNPPPASLPQLAPGILSLTVLTASLLLIVALLCYQRAGARGGPGPGR